MSRADFSEASVGKPRRFFSAYFSLTVAPFSADNASNGPKCACVVSKKAAAKAVDRNLIKRRCREACSLAIKGLSARCSFVFYAKKEARGATYRELEADIRKLLAQAR